MSSVLIDACSLVAVFATAFAGFMLFALSQPRHWRTFFPKSIITRSMNVVFRVTATAVLCISLAVALWRDGASFGALLWSVAISLAGLAVVAILTWRGRWLGQR